MPQWGDYEGDERRKNRQVSVDPDDHHRLARRVTDITSRIVLVETSQVLMTRDQSNLRDQVGSIIGNNTRVIEGMRDDFDEQVEIINEQLDKSFKWEIIFSGITLVNVVVILAGICVIVIAYINR